MFSGLAIRAAESDNPYRYIPSPALSVTFLTIFSLLLIPHTYLAFRSRFKWMLVVSVACLIEVIGWAGRIWSRQEILGGGFKMQISCLVIAPTFLSAALYVLLSLVIKEIAPHQSKLNRRWFNIIFISADVFSLVVQAIGGGIAGSADTDSQIDLGSKILLAGIIIQLLVMVFFLCYCLLWSYLFRPEIKDSVNRNARWLLIGIIVSSILVIIRGIYRTAELSQGFRGYLATHELYFLLDAIPVAAATLVMLILHPYFFSNTSALDDREKNSSLTRVNTLDVNNQREKLDNQKFSAGSSRS